MKVQVITRHAVSNYGSLLQAIATQKIIEKAGCECEIVDYQRYDEHYLRIDKTLLASKEQWNCNAMKRVVYLALRQPESIIAGKKFAKMQKEYLHLSEKYTNEEELKKLHPKADIYMTGSDQVWGKLPNGHYDGSYFLDYVEDDGYKVAFAASMGHSVKNEAEEKKFKEWLKRYDKIAVREDSAKEYLETIDVAADQVLDPTLIVEAQEWQKMAKISNKGKYVLVYQIHNDKRVGAYAQKVAEKLNLPLIRVSASLHQISREGKLKYLPNISEFLGYIENAEFIVTDSFHGTAFSINFNKQFAEILPNTNTGSRNQSILRLTGLLERVVTDMNDFSVLDSQIDYDSVNKILQNERTESVNKLKEILVKN